MNNTMIKTFLLLSLLAPCHTIMAQISQNDIEIHNFDKQLNHSLVYIDEDASKSIVELEGLLPNYAWSSSFKNLCHDIRNEGTVVSHDFISQVLSECLVACNMLSEAASHSPRTVLTTYAQKLDAGKAHLNALADDESDNEADAETRKCCKKKKPKKICNLCVQQCLSAGALSVSGNVTIGGILTVDGVNFNTLSALAGALGATGAAGVPGIGGVLGWGYIYNLGPQVVGAPTGSPVFFDNQGPLNGITHTPGSDAIGIVAAGTYLINFSVSGTEATGNQFAIARNGSLVADGSTVYGSGAGTQQNNGQTILVLQAGDTIRLVNYISATSITLQTLAGGTATNVNASVVILRIA